VQEFLGTSVLTLAAFHQLAFGQLTQLVLRAFPAARRWPTAYALPDPLPGLKVAAWLELRRLTTKAPFVDKHL